MTGYKDIQPEISENKATLTVEAFPVQMQPYIVSRFQSSCFYLL